MNTEVKGWLVWGPQYTWRLRSQIRQKQFQLVENRFHGKWQFPARPPFALKETREFLTGFNGILYSGISANRNSKGKCDFFFFQINSTRRVFNIFIIVFYDCLWIIIIKKKIYNNNNIQWDDRQEIICNLTLSLVLERAVAYLDFSGL